MGFNIYADFRVVNCNFENLVITNIEFHEDGLRLICFDIKENEYKNIYVRSED